MLLRMVAAGFAIRLLVVAFLLPQYASQGDTVGTEAGRIACSILSGEGFSNPFPIPTGPTAWHAPVYPYLIAGVFRLFGIYSLTSSVVLLTLNCLLSALTALPTYGMAASTFDRKTARVAGWIWAFFPYAILFATKKAYEAPLYVLLFAVMFHVTLRLSARMSVREWAGYGLLCGITALIHPTVLVVLPVLWCWQGWRMEGPTSKRAGRLALVTGTFLLVILPWTVRNYLVFDRFVPMRSNLWFELRVGNPNNLYQRYTKDTHLSWSPEENRKMQRLGELGYMDKQKRIVLAFIRGHPETFVRRTLARVVTYWTAGWDWSWEYFVNHPFNSADIPFCTLLSVLAFLGLWQLSRTRMDLAVPYWSVALLYPAVYYVTQARGKLRLGVDPFLVVMLASTLVTVWQARRLRAAPASSSTAHSQPALDGQP